MAKNEQWPPRRGLPGKKRFKKGRKLQWGETPFDDLSRAELLRLVQAYHSAITAARSVMVMHAEAAPSPYWSEGPGSRALAKANYLYDLCGNNAADPASEKIYRSFFRTADPLLFPFLTTDRFHNWGVNSKGEMVAPYLDQKGYRRIKWADVCPQDAQ